LSFILALSARESFGEAGNGQGGQIDRCSQGNSRQTIAPAISHSMNGPSVLYPGDGGHEKRRDGKRRAFETLGRLTKPVQAHFQCFLRAP
jgi:hypothetical protein